MSAEHQTPEQAADADRKADVKAILVIFTTMVLMAAAACSQQLRVRVPKRWGNWV